MTRHAVSELRRAANGRWPDILTSLGMQADSLTAHNKPCPACGGTDRFSFTDMHGTGSFVCRASDRQGGDGFELVMHWLSCDFPGALDAVAQALGDDTGAPRSSPPPAAQPAPRTPSKDRVEALRDLWRHAYKVSEGDTVARYLVNRGLNLPAVPKVIRHHPALAYWHKNGNGKPPLRLGVYPAMLAAVQGEDGRTVALHRTWLTPAGAKAAPVNPTTGKVMPVKKLICRNEQVMPGSAIRLYPPESGRLALAEGIETAFAVRLIHGIPVWSCVTANGLSAVRLPPEVAEVFIAADNDANGAGQRAAQALGRRLSAEGRRVEILTPSLPGLDWLDVLNAAEGCPA